MIIAIAVYFVVGAVMVLATDRKNGFNNHCRRFSTKAAMKIGDKDGNDKA